MTQFAGFLASSRERRYARIRRKTQHSARNFKVEMAKAERHAGHSREASTAFSEACTAFLRIMSIIGAIETARQGSAKRSRRQERSRFWCAVSFPIPIRRCALVCPPRWRRPWLSCRHRSLRSHVRSSLNSGSGMSRARPGPSAVVFMSPLFPAPHFPLEFLCSHQYISGVPQSKLLLEQHWVQKNLEQSMTQNGQPPVEKCSLEALAKATVSRI
jgi:hypothetical protein